MTILDKLNELEELADAATQGPWFQSLAAIVGANSLYVADLVSDQIPNKPAGQINADGRLIAASRTAMPQLIEAIRVADDLLDRLSKGNRSAGVMAIAKETRAHIAKILEVNG